MLIQVLWSTEPQEVWCKELQYIGEEQDDFYSIWPHTCAHCDSEPTQREAKSLQSMESKISELNTKVEIGPGLTHKDKRDGGNMYIVSKADPV